VVNLYGGLKKADRNFIRRALESPDQPITLTLDKTPSLDKAGPHIFDAIKLARDMVIECVPDTRFGFCHSMRTSVKPFSKKFLGNKVRSEPVHAPLILVRLGQFFKLGHAARRRDFTRIG